MDQLNGLRMQHHEQTMRQMIAEIHQGKLNIAQAAVKFEVNRSTVKNWLKKIESETEEDLQTTPIQPETQNEAGHRRSSKQDNSGVNELQNKIHLLEEELKETRFKALYYAALLRTAEQELGVDIEKKSVTKQFGTCL
jgi:transposase-like protein